MDSPLNWFRIAAIAWGAALLIAVLAEVRPFMRLIPDWLRNLARVVLLTGALGVLALGVLLGRYLVESTQVQAAAATRPTLNLSFESPDAFLQSLYLSLHQQELDQPASDDSTDVTFVVSPGETAASVAARLEEEGLVVSGEVFRRFMAFEGLDASLQAGTYTLRASMTMRELADALQHGSVDTVTVLIPEGWRAEQVAWLLDQKGLVRSDDFMAQVTTGEYDYPWLSSRPSGASLEGFLFPDTYQFPKLTTASDVIDRMLANFDARAADAIEAALPGREIYDVKTGSYRPLTLFDVVTLASIVEKEAVVPEERPIIASVYFNRLDPAYVNETALRLNADPTVQYAKGYDPVTDSWWSRMAPDEGQTLVHPYNTFKVQGLPPGPISNPGMASIEAVLNPAQTSYLYFHAVGDGSHVFARTLEEHQRNQERYKP